MEQATSRGRKRMFNSQVFSLGFKSTPRKKMIIIYHYTEGTLRKFAYFFLPLDFLFSWCINHSKTLISYR